MSEEIINFLFPGLREYEPKRETGDGWCRYGKHAGSQQKDPGCRGEYYLGSAVVEEKTNEIPVARELFRASGS